MPPLSPHPWPPLLPLPGYSPTNPFPLLCRTPYTLTPLPPLAPLYPLPPPQLILNTSPDVGDLREVLGYIYDEIYAEYVAKNPLYQPGQPFR